MRKMATSYHRFATICRVSHRERKRPPHTVWVLPPYLLSPAVSKPCKPAWFQLVLTNYSETYSCCDDGYGRESRQPSLRYYGSHGWCTRVEYYVMLEMIVLPTGKVWNYSKCWWENDKFLLARLYFWC